MRFLTGAVLASAAVIAVSAANAEEVRLDDAALDNVTAGLTPGITLIPGNSSFAQLFNEPGIERFDENTDVNDVGGAGTQIGQGAALISFALEAQFEAENEGEPIPSGLASILGFLDQIAIDRDVDPASFPPDQSQGAGLQSLSLAGN